MPATIFHIKSATTPDDPTYEILPSDWNSGHTFTLAISGDELTGAFADYGGITFGYGSAGSITAKGRTDFLGSGAGTAFLGTEAAAGFLGSGAGSAFLGTAYSASDAKTAITGSFGSYLKSTDASTIYLNTTDASSRFLGSGAGSAFLGSAAGASYMASGAGTA